MSDSYEIQPAAEFQQLPLEMLISAPLTGAVKAQSASASATLLFIQSMMTNNGNVMTPTTTSFKTSVQMSDAGGAQTTQKVDVTVPLLAITPIPNLLIDHVTTEFDFSISQTYQETTKVNATASLDVGLNAPAKWLVNASLKGNISRESSKEQNVSRSGSLKVKVEASQAPIPEGLAKILSFVTQGISTQKSA